MPCWAGNRCCVCCCWQFVIVGRLDLGFRHIRSAVVTSSISVNTEERFSSPKVDCVCHHQSRDLSSRAKSACTHICWGSDTASRTYDRVIWGEEVDAHCTLNVKSL